MIAWVGRSAGAGEEAGGADAGDHPERDPGRLGHLTSLRRIHRGVGGPGMSRTRSWWGWGTVEDAVGELERADLLARVAAMMPGAVLAAHEPPDVATLDLPPVRLVPPAPLAGLCSMEPVDRAAHSRGKAFRDVVRNLHGDSTDVPDLVVRPRRRAGRRRRARLVLRARRRRRSPTAAAARWSAASSRVRRRLRRRVSHRPRRGSTGCWRSTARVAGRAHPGRRVRPARWRTSSGRTA